MGSFVQFAGTSCGAGKSTLSRALAAALGERGEAVEFVEEEALFRLPELAPLAERFLRKDFPGPDDLLAAFEAFLAARPSVDWIVNDGSWVLLGEDLPWAQASWEAVVGYARGLREVVVERGLEPRLLFLDAPVEVAVERARRRDGEERFNRWLSYSRGLPAMASMAAASDVEVVAAGCVRVRRILDEAGWAFVSLPAGESKEVVLDAALEALGIR